NIIKEVTQVFSNEIDDYLKHKFFLSIEDFKLNLIDKVGKVLKRINAKNPVILPLIVVYDEPETSSIPTTNS
ncbi:MAG: hypothetical protein FJ352_03110, partial [Firmicutes bacterium]|nr:hypothetical protein [Bacillota bacterium]